MYWHIDTDIVSLIVLVAIYIYNARILAQREPAMQSRHYLWCFRAGIAVTIIDIAASIVMEVPVNRCVYHLLMTLYFLAVEGVIVEWFLYSLTLLYPGKDAMRGKLAFWVILPYGLYTLIVLSNPWTGLIYTLDENNLYQRGSFFMLMVVLYALYVLSLLFLTMLRRKRIVDKHSRRILLLLPLILSVSIAVQLLNPGWLMILPGYMICLLLATLFMQTKQTKDSQALVQVLSHAATTDALTGLANRAGIESQVQQCLHSRTGTKCMVAIVDIDDLKLINDKLGHSEGDRAIRDMAGMLQGHFRASDIVARYGGDEFLVALIGNMDEMQAHRLLRRLVDSLATLRVGEDNATQIHASIGAAFGVVGDDFKTLCDQADIALYHVKRRGKNGYALFDPKMEPEPPLPEMREHAPVS